MLEIHPLLFVGIVLSVLLLAFGAGFVVLVIVGQRATAQFGRICETASGAMADANREYQRQLGQVGEIMSATNAVQEQHLREAHARYWHATRLLMTAKVPQEVVDSVLGQAGLPGGPRHRIPMRTPQEEARLVRERRMAAFRQEAGDGTIENGPTAGRGEATPPRPAAKG